MMIEMTTLRNNKGEVAVIYSGDVVDVLDDKVRVLIDNSSAITKTYIDISKDTIVNIAMKYILEDELFKEKVVEIVADFINNIPEIDPDTIPILLEN